MFEVKINDKLGIHARPAAMIVKAVSNFKGDVFFIKDNIEYNAKSIMKIMSMGLSNGDVFYIKAEGEGSEDLKNEVKKIVEGL